MGCRIGCDLATVHAQAWLSLYWRRPLTCSRKWTRGKDGGIFWSNENVPLSLTTPLHIPNIPNKKMTLEGLYPSQGGGLFPPTLSTYLLLWHLKQRKVNPFLTCLGSPWALDSCFCSPSLSCLCHEHLLVEVTLSWVQPSPHLVQLRPQHGWRAHGAQQFCWHETETLVWFVLFLYSSACGRSVFSTGRCC